ncbi:MULTISPECIES: immunoglobulin-like domain-containing protein [unclassified Enterococcus]|uniref:immunoglobulin-like domain-containing protein n=1 Tax=unclassified Enterococcus TaxID=2608891 RepID=UPI003F284E8A
MKQDDKQSRCSHLGTKKLNRTILIGTATALLIGGSALGLTKLNQEESKTSLQQTEPTSSTKQGNSTSKDKTTILSPEESKSSESSKLKKDKTLAILEHFGILQSEMTEEMNLMTATQLKPEELSVIATTLKQSIGVNEQSAAPSVELMDQTISDDTLVPPIIVEKPTEPEPPVVEDPTPVWVGPKIYPLIQSPVIQQNGLFQASDYFYVTAGSDLEPTITMSTIDTSIVGTQMLTINVMDSQGYSDTLTIPIYVNSRPTLLVTTEELTIPIDSTVDLTSFVTAEDLEDGPLSEKVTYTTDLDSSVEGVYTVNYRVEDKYGAATTASMKVCVENEAPSISNVDMTIPVLSTFTPEEYLSQVVVKDREDGHATLTFNEEEMAAVDPMTPGIYEVTLTATDSHGKSTTVAGRIIVENSAPELLGVSDRTIYVGEVFNPLDGISVLDKEETLDISQVVVSGEYDISTPGEYTIVLSVSDSFIETNVSFVLTVLPSAEDSDPDKSEEDETPSNQNSTEEAIEEESIPEESKEETQAFEDSVVGERQTTTQISQEVQTK